MPAEQKPFAFTDHLRLNNGETVPFEHCKCGGKIDDHPRSLEEAVAEYIATVLKEENIPIENISTVDEYEKVGRLVTQSELLTKTYFRSIIELLECSTLYGAPSNKKP